ncbi:hypothetical protein WJX73_008629 [Symbiochloris irregularis]|uniref:Uncharacterized protein n=1 Tax=Symbiochloris irregularis TaxID=706552 RepID=A0AAW1PR62_9CHLO
MRRREEFATLSDLQWRTAQGASGFPQTAQDQGRGHLDCCAPAAAAAAVSADLSAHIPSRRPPEYLIAHVFHSLRWGLEDIYDWAMYLFDDKELYYPMTSSPALTAGEEGLSLEELLSESWWPERCRALFDCHAERGKDK